MSGYKIERSRQRAAVGQLIHLSDHALPSDAQASAIRDGAAKPSGTTRYHFWCGASGERYVHTVHSLLECPEMPAANYILGRRRGDGQVETLAIGHVDTGSPSLNLAHIRHQGATLGASEVHLHLLAKTSKHAKLIAYDLKSGHCGDAIPSSHAHH